MGFGPILSGVFELLSLVDAIETVLKKVIWDIVYLIIEIEIQPFYIYSRLSFV